MDLWQSVFWQSVRIEAEQPGRRTNMRPKALRTVAWMTGAALILSQSCPGTAAEPAAEMTVSAAILPEEIETEPGEITDEVEAVMEEPEEIPEETAEEVIWIMEEPEEIEAEPEEAAEELNEIPEEPEAVAEEPEQSEETVKEPEEIAGESVMSTGEAEITDEYQEGIAEEFEIAEEEPEVIAVEPEITEEEPETVTVEPEIIEGETEAVAVEPEIIEEEPETIAVEPEIIEEEPETIAVEPEIIEEEPETITMEPEIIEEESEAVAVEPEIIEEEPEAIAEEFEITEEEPEAVAVEPEIIGEEPEAVAKEAEETEEDPGVMTEETAEMKVPENTYKDPEHEVFSEEAANPEEPEIIGDEKAQEEALEETADTEAMEKSSLITIGEPDFAAFEEMQETDGNGENTLRLSLSLEEHAIKNDSVQVYVESTNKAVEDRLNVRQMENETGMPHMISLEGIPEDQSGDGIYLVTVLAADLQGNLISSRKEIRVNRFGSVYELLPAEQPDPASAGSGQTSGQDKASGLSDHVVKEETSGRDLQYLPLQISERNVDEIVSSKIYYSRNGEELRQCSPEAVRVSCSKTSDGWMEYQYRIDKNIFTEEGCYEIQLLSCDRGGNRNCYGSGGETIRFTVDHTAPEVLVTGPEDGAVYEDDVWSCIEVRDGSGLEEVSVYLDGKREQTWSKEQLGKQDCLLKWKAEDSGHWTTMQIMAKDTAGNITLTRPASFLIYKEEQSVV